MIRLVFFAVVASAGIALCAAAYYFGTRITFATQWPLFEALRNTASIIFAVVGAWLAIIYPERLKISFGQPGRAERSSAGIGILLTPAIHSTIILAILLLVGVIAPILKQIPEIMAHVPLFRGISFAMVTFLTLWQIVIVVMTVTPADMLKRSSDAEQAERQIHDQYNRLIRTHDGDPPG